MKPNPLYFRTEFLQSATTLREAPPDEGREVAFAGRSNAGKSSVINTITQRKNLARTSKTPGRTQLLNFFQVTDSCRLVDLPGYGYAKVPKAMQAAWGKAMENYLADRQALQGVFLIMDIRHPLTDFDWQLIDWCSQTNLELHLVLTKADKLSRGAAGNTLLQVQRRVQSEGITASAQLFSSLSRSGLETAHSVLDHWLHANL
ncbi:MAG: YihA family ribosome biogenesis GTP-binding protein [Methylococcaceae bacterium]|nr:MAG: YihA family ribosome biogenesis GTP-binding protein [Methylococcaceae bacterium]